MEIKIDISYTEKIMPPRCRKAQKQRHDGTFKVKIKEVSSEDAPVAFNVKLSCDPDTIVRSYKGKLYREAHVYILDENRNRKYVSLCETPWHSILSSPVEKTKEETEQAIKIRSKEFLIIDNCLYRLTGEPYYNYVCFGLGHNHGGTGLFVEWADRSRRTIRGYAANDYENVVADTKAMAIRRGDTNSISYIERGDNCHIAVLMPECIKRKYQPQTKK